MKDEKMGENKLREAYDRIPIPVELEKRVLEAVEQGKRESCDKKTADFFRKLPVRVGQTAAAALLAITVLANSNANIAYAMEQLPLIGSITKVVTFRTYERKEGNTEAKIRVPGVEVESGSPIESAAGELNRSVEEYTNQIISKFEEDVRTEGKEMHKGVYSDYEVVTDNDRLFTLRINTTEVMASGAESVKLYSIDKQTGKILSLKDLFAEGTDYVGLLSEEIKTQMEAQMADGSGRMYFLHDGMESDFKSIRENQNFYIDKDGHLVLVFDEYEVAPGVMGVVEFTMPGNLFQF